jgi:hypothetical protein
MTQDAYSINTATDNGRKLHEELTGVWDTIRTTHAGIARPDYASVKIERRIARMHWEHH